MSDSVHRDAPLREGERVFATLARARNNFVVDVSEVAHVGHTVAQVAEHAYKHVEAAVHPRVPCRIEPPHTPLSDTCS